VAAALRPGRPPGALHAVGRHRRQGLPALGYPRFRLRAVEAARRSGLLGPVPRHRRAGPDRWATVRCASFGPLPFPELNGGPMTDELTDALEDMITAAQTHLERVRAAAGR